MIVGWIVVLGLALLAIAFTALLLASGWNAVREELWPGFRMDPPRPRSLALTLLGVVLPVLLIAALTTYLAIWLLGLIMGV